MGNIKFDNYQLEIKNNRNGQDIRTFSFEPVRNILSDDILIINTNLVLVDIHRPKDDPDGSFSLAVPLNRENVEQVISFL